MNGNLLFAKVFVYLADGKTFDRMINYHNVESRGKGVENFEKFIRGKYPGVHHINYYSEKDRVFQYQTYLKG